MNQRHPRIVRGCLLGSCLLPGSCLTKRNLLAVGAYPKLNHLLHTPPRFVSHETESLSLWLRSHIFETLQNH